MAHQGIRETPFCARKATTELKIIRKRTFSFINITIATAIMMIKMYILHIIYVYMCMYSISDDDDDNDDVAGVVESQMNPEENDIYICTSRQIVIPFAHVYAMHI